MRAIGNGYTSKIAINKRLEIDLLKVEFPLSLIRKKLPDTRQFRLSEALTKDDLIHVIAEIKKGRHQKELYQKILILNC